MCYNLNAPSLADLVKDAEVKKHEIVGLNMQSLTCDVSARRFEEALENAQWETDQFQALPNNIGCGSEGPCFDHDDPV